MMIRGIQYGDQCTHCKNHVIQEPCKKGHEIVITDGCEKCGKWRRKEVSNGKMEFCPDWLPSPNVIFDW